MTQYLVIGGGSMGKRRVRCLLKTGIEPSAIRLVELREERRREVTDTLGVECFESLKPGFDWGANAVLVSVPGGQHMEICLAAARAGLHIFCEVPLALNLTGTDELAMLAKEKGLLVAPGCQPVYHPVFRQVREWVRDPAFGRVLIFHEQFGQYLPDWHPYEDYRCFYASNLEQGGGNLDVIAQEMTLAQWVTGDTLNDVFCRSENLSTLDLRAPDIWQALATAKSGAAYTLQFDLIQRAAYCARRFVSENGTVEMQNGVARRYLAGRGAWESTQDPNDYCYEQCYIDEIKHFVSCVEGKGQWPITLEDALRVVAFLVAMKSSADLKRAVSLNDVWQ